MSCPCNQSPSLQCTERGSSRRSWGRHPHAAVNKMDDFHRYLIEIVMGRKISGVQSLYGSGYILGSLKGSGLEVSTYLPWYWTVLLSTQAPTLDSMFKTYCWGLSWDLSLRPSKILVWIGMTSIRPRKKIFVFQVNFLDFPGSHGWKKSFSVKKVYLI